MRSVRLLAATALGLLAAAAPAGACSIRAPLPGEEDRAFVQAKLAITATVSKVRVLRAVFVSRDAALVGYGTDVRWG